jgi:LPS export ABC transporter protein LptC
MPRARAILLCLVVAGFAALVLVPRRPPGVDVSFTATGVVLHTYTEAGDLSWEIYAREGRVVDEKGTLSDVKIHFISPDAPSLSASADRFSRGEDGSILSGGVRIEREDGLRLETEEMTWNEREEQLHAGAIDLTIRDARVEGERFEYDLRDERATITGGVLATVDREPKVSVRGDRAVEEDDVLSIEGSVQIESEDGSYQCDRIQADTETVRLIGGVEGLFKDGELRAERASIAGGGLTATGNVSLSLDLASERETDAP